MELGCRSNRVGIAHPLKVPWISSEQHDWVFKWKWTALLNIETLLITCVTHSTVNNDAWTATLLLYSFNFMNTIFWQLTVEVCKPLSYCSPDNIPFLQTLLLRLMPQQISLIFIIIIIKSVYSGHNLPMTVSGPKFVYLRTRAVPNHPNCVEPRFEIFRANSRSVPEMFVRCRSFSTVCLDSKISCSECVLQVTHCI